MQREVRFRSPEQALAVRLVVPGASLSVRSKDRQGAGGREGRQQLDDERVVGIGSLQESLGVCTKYFPCQSNLALRHQLSCRLGQQLRRWGELANVRQQLRDELRTRRERLDAKHQGQGELIQRLRRESLEQLDLLTGQLDALLAMDEMNASLPFRPLMDRLTDLYYVACLGVEAAWEAYKKQDRSKQRLAEFFLDRRVLRREAIDIPNYGEQVSRLCADIRPGPLLPKDHKDELEEL